MIHLLKPCFHLLVLGIFFAKIHHVVDGAPVDMTKGIGDCHQGPVEFFHRVAARAPERRMGGQILCIR